MSRNQEGTAILHFVDNGPGLPEFAEVTEDSRDNPPSTGYGLGLSLVERICAVQGWQIEKSPRHDGGTWIQITLAVP